MAKYLRICTKLFNYNCYHPNRQKNTINSVDNITGVSIIEYNINLQKIQFKLSGHCAIHATWRAPYNEKNMILLYVPIMKVSIYITIICKRAPSTLTGDADNTNVEETKDQANSLSPLLKRTENNHYAKATGKLGYSCRKVSRTGFSATSTTCKFWRKSAALRIDWLCEVERLRAIEQKALDLYDRWQRR